jgi:hypothetical protein
VIYMNKDIKKVRMNPVLRKFHLDDKKFTTSQEIKKISKEFGINPTNTIRNLMARGHLVRIFRGIFYIRSFDEVKMGKMKYSHLDLVSKGLGIMGVEDWYFCLHTALKLNNLTHEFRNVDYIATTQLFRGKPINIAGHIFSFHKLSPSLFDFGINRERPPLRYSDPEKTVLDMVYMRRYNGIPSERIRIEVAEYLGKLDIEVLSDYLAHYPGSVKVTLVGLI